MTHTQKEMTTDIGKRTYSHQLRSDVNRLRALARLSRCRGPRNSTAVHHDVANFYPNFESPAEHYIHICMARLMLQTDLATLEV